MLFGLRSFIQDQATRSSATRVARTWRARRIARHLVGALALLVLSPSAASVLAVEHVTLVRDGQEVKLVGNVLVEAADGGVLLVVPDGELWAVPPSEIKQRSHDDEPFVPLSREELAERLLRQLPENFAAHQTAHYVVLFDTSRAYAQWAGALFERLFSAFTNYWTRKGFTLRAPEFPLPVVLFADRQMYQKFAEPDLRSPAEPGTNPDGAADDSGRSLAENIIGYYNLRTNRVTTFDLTGIEQLRQPGDRRGSSAQINRMLDRPQAAKAVTTLVHEATHQIAFNAGLQERYTDIPMWVSEGIAMFFETPDLRSQKGWRNVGVVNYARLDSFRRYLLDRPSGSLESLLATDERFRNAQTAEAAYAEAWAMVYFLTRQRPKEFQVYLDGLSRKKRLIWDEPVDRLEEFEAAIGERTKLEADFLRYLMRVE